jgi:hypothetical protein
MTDPLAVSPDGLRAAGEHLEEVSSRLKNVLTSLHTKLAAEGVAWGDDKSGHGFADGPQGYLAQVKWVDDSVGAKTDLLDFYAESIRNAANTLEGQDNG